MKILSLPLVWVSVDPEVETITIKDVSIVTKRSYVYWNSSV